MGPPGDTHAGFFTIASAIAAAVAAGASSSAPANIYIKPNVNGYVENLTLADGINLIGFAQDGIHATGAGAVIQGKITVTATGTTSINSLTLMTNSDYVVEITGSNTLDLLLNQCFILLSNANGIHCTNSNATVLLNYSQGNCGTNTNFVFTGGSISVQYCNLAGNGSTTASTFANANFDALYSTVDHPITTSGTGSFAAESSIFLCANTTCVTHGGSSLSLVHHSRFESGTASCISIGAAATLPVLNSSFLSSNTNVITGTGILKYALLSFYGSSSGTNVTTQTPLATLL